MGGMLSHHRGRSMASDVDLRWTLVVTGAGFSAEAGFPVTNALWRVADEMQNCSFDEFGIATSPREQLDLADYILHKELKLLERPLRESDAEVTFDHLRSMMPKSGWVHGWRKIHEIFGVHDVNCDLYVAYQAL